MGKGTFGLAFLAMAFAACVAGAPLLHSPCPCPAALGYTCCGTGSAGSCMRLAPGETCSTVSSGPDATTGSDGGTDMTSDLRSPADKPLPQVTNPFASIAMLSY